MAKKRNRKRPQKQDNYSRICSSDIKSINWDGKKAKIRLEHMQFARPHCIIPLYPFRFDTFWVNVYGCECKKINLKDEVYDFTESDLDIICKTIGFAKLFDLPYVNAFLSNNCSVQNLNDCSWPYIIGQLEWYLQKQSSIETEKKPTAASGDQQQKNITPSLISIQNSNVIMGDIKKAENVQLGHSGEIKSDKDLKDNLKVKEGVLKPKPPEILQKILWVLKYGRRYWWLILLALLLILFSLILPRFL